jgi:hypothetical protein
MVMTTGSYPAALSGGSESPEDKRADETPSERAPKAGGSSYDKEFLAAQEKGYSPRKAMAAGIVKC